MKKLRELRKENKLTTKELGEKLSLSQSTISLYESGKRQPDLDTLKKIAQFFNVSVDYLLGKEDKMHQLTPNTIRIIGRGGFYKDYNVSDEERKAYETLLENGHIDPDVKI